MKFVIPLLAVLTALATGCATKKDPPPASAALDVAPTGGLATATPAYGSPQPSMYTPPSPAYAPPTPVVTADPTRDSRPAGGQTYTVQKGDTLYKIARDHYGDPKQWTRIAAANPGMNANAIKVGQKITLP